MEIPRSYLKMCSRENLILLPANNKGADQHVDQCSLRCSAAGLQVAILSSADNEPNADSNYLTPGASGRRWKTTSGYMCYILGNTDTVLDD